MANQYRDKMIRELKSQGVFYTERHLGVTTDTGAVYNEGHITILQIN